MKKQKLIYRYNRYSGDVVQAKREIAYDIRLTTRLILDELCFNWNKQQLSENIDQALDEQDEAKFIACSNAYKQFIWES